MTQHIDIYCERLDASFWSEPVNAVSNIAFLIAVYLGYLLWKKSPRTNENLALLVIAVIVGVGSFIFHTFATRPAMFADIIPIIVFIHYALVLLMRRAFNLSLRTSLILIAIFFGINLAVKLGPYALLLNGSMQYVPTFFALLVMAVISFSNRKPFCVNFVVASLAFLFSLTFRSIDTQICPSFPLGTHFLWHMLNPVVMYCAMRVLIKQSGKVDISI